MLNKLLAIALVMFAVSSNGMSFNNPTSALIGTMIQGKINERAMMDAMKRGTTTAPAAARHQPIAASDFRSSGKRLVVDVVVGALTSTPQQRATLAGVVNQVFDAYEAKVRKNNVAYAMAFMLAAAVVVDKGISLNDDQTNNLAVQLNDRIVGNPAFANASPSDRQKVYETFVATGSLMLLFNEAGKTNADSAKLAKMLAAQAFTLLPK